jgi:hypothetical protein
MVAFSGFYESHEPHPLGNAHSIVPPHCDGHRNGQQSWYMLHRCFVDCRLLGGRRGDSERVVARWRRPVASGEALVMLHRVMLSVCIQCIQVVIKMACSEGAFLRHRRLFRLA